MKTPKGYLGSRTDPVIRDLFQTPPYLYEWYNRQHMFTHDVASSDANHLAPFWFTEADNALERDWGTVNWCNPPYSNITPWVTKAIEESTKGNVTVMLIPADTSVGWFKLAFDNCASCDLISGRISFINATTGKPQSGNNKGSVVFTFGLHNRKEVQLLNRKDLE